jgi:uncharacterized membrane protein YdjX (TVP38/TMEM64 family)
MLWLIPAAHRVMLDLRTAGPAVFFVAMALLPAAGFPLMAFALAVGPLFGPALGAGWVIGWSLAAVVVNLLVSYWLADRALRPLAGRLLRAFDCHLPDRPCAGAWQLAWVVRLTPGPPFWMASSLLALVRVPLVPYLVVSTTVMAGYLMALVGGGAAMAEGNWPLAAAAVGGLVATAALLRGLRRWMERRRNPAHVPGPVEAALAK